MVIAQNNKHQTVFVVHGENDCTLSLRIGLFQRIQIFDKFLLFKSYYISNKITGTIWQVKGQKIKADTGGRAFIGN